MTDNSIAKHRGVTFDKRRNKYLANIKIQGKNKFLGYFNLNDFDKAVATRLEAEKQYQQPIKEERKKYEEDIIKTYQSGLSLKDTGEKFFINESSVWEILDKNNIPRRTNIKDCNVNEIVNAYQNGETLQDLSNKTGLSNNTIARRLEKENIPRRQRRYFIDENVLDVIDCEWKAYFLGLLFADGNVRKIENGYCSTIRLNIKDKEILEALSIKLYGTLDFLKYAPARIYTSIKTKKSSNTGPTVILQIFSKKIIEKLINYGCIPNKSLILEWPKGIPNNLMRHFIRGYFDGDGWLSGKTVGFISSYEFCLSLQSYLLSHLSIQSYYKKDNKVGRVLIHKKSYIQSLYKYMYDNATIFLKRKHDKFLERLCI
jgi:intein/homing endonuclease